ncbi:MAG TPA: nitrous oxide reductase family maturation protein NosD [Gemmatimonadales bacterium]|nr:nitrous oxide reductase family maturation protein NosD [Gemmatimonadales bacterium]
MLALVAVLAQVTLASAPGVAQPTITAALARAVPGDTVRVPAGVWREPTLRVRVPLVLLGARGAILDGEGQRELVVLEAPGVTVQGFTFRNTGRAYHEDRAAVHVNEVGDCVVRGNRFEATFFAIYLQRTTGCTVVDNVIIGIPDGEAATGNAIHSWGSSNLAVRNNRIRGHRDGIYLEFTRHAEVRGNASERNLRYGLHFMYADSSTYADNAFVANGSGVAVMYSKVVAMHGNRFEHNRGATAYGLLLKEIADVTLRGNRFTDNTTGLLADGAERVAVEDNTFEANGWGVRLLGSTTGGHFTGNRFRGNSFDVATNGRTTSATFAANWWDGYRGYDLDRDGTGDLPHHPVRLFALMVERSEPAMLLQRSFFTRVLDAAERVLPVLTPKDVVDATPRMRPTPGGVR